MTAASNTHFETPERGGLSVHGVEQPLLHFSDVDWPIVDWPIIVDSLATSAPPRRSSIQQVVDLQIDPSFSAASRSPYNSKNHGQSSPVSLDNLPTELLVLIAETLDDVDLYRLSFLSARLHHLVLPLFLNRQGIADPLTLSNGTAFVGGRFPNLVLEGLRRACFVSSIHRLHCVFPSHAFDAVNLRHEMQYLVRKLSSLEEVCIEHPTVMKYGSFLSTDDMNWQGQLTGLLESLVPMSCTSLTVRDDGQNRGRNSDHKAYETVISADARRPLKWVRKHVFRHTTPDSQYFTTLHTLILESALFNRYPLLNWALSTMKHSSPSLTKLVLRHIPFSPGAWADFLNPIQLPNLTELIIASLTIPFKDLSNFLSRHTRVTTLDLSNGSLDSDPPRLPYGRLCRLRSLCATPEHIVHIFGSGDSHRAHFPHLSSIFVQPLYAAAIPIPRFSFITRALESIAQVISQRVELTLSIPGASLFSPWLDVNSDDRVESKLRCVVGLHLRTINDVLLSEDAMAFVPSWLALFPVLTRISFGRACLPLENLASEVAFVSWVIRVCPRMESVEIGDRKLGIEEWLSMGMTAS